MHLTKKFNKGILFECVSFVWRRGGGTLRVFFIFERDLKHAR